MRTFTHRIPFAWIIAFVFVLLVGFALATEGTVEIPAIKADLGPCSADFTVTDAEGKPVYNAKIKATIRHGIMSKRKLDLEVGTNSDGKARFVGLPAKVKRPFEFTIQYGSQTASKVHDPSLECEAKFDIALGK